MKLKKSAVSSQEAPAQEQGSAFLSSRFRLDNVQAEANAAAAARSTRLDVAGGICAILTTLILVGVTVMMYLNWTEIQLV